MRVIAGTYGGRTLKAPPGAATRPTSDRVREALFSILGDRVPDARVLDLFAGSGALGLEALSRGADSVTFVDDAPAAIRAVKANLTALDAAATVRQTDALRFLAAASGNGAQYDLSSSIPRTGRQSASRARCRRPSPPCWRPGRWPWQRATDGRR